MLEGRDWVAVAGATPDEIAALRAAAPIPLPETYVALLEFSNGGEGPLPGQPCYFCLYPALEVSKFERDGAFYEFFPGLFVFGSNGGGEAVAIDTADADRRIVYFDTTNIDLDESVQPLAENFDAFVGLIGLE